MLSHPPAEGDQCQKWLAIISIPTKARASDKNVFISSHELTKLRVTSAAIHNILAKPAMISSALLLFLLFLALISPNK